MRRLGRNERHVEDLMKNVSASPLPGAPLSQGPLVNLASSRVGIVCP
jgi:hypothetical protein